jgi:hypothetical protein
MTMVKGPGTLSAFKPPVDIKTLEAEDDRKNHRDE